jgi:hypothetical protein
MTSEAIGLLGGATRSAVQVTPQPSCDAGPGPQETVTAIRVSRRGNPRLGGGGRVRAAAGTAVPGSGHPPEILPRARKLKTHSVVEFLESRFSLSAGTKITHKILQSLHAPVI